MEFTTTETGRKVVIAPAGLDEAFTLKAKINKAFIENKVNPQEAITTGDLLAVIMAMDSSLEVLNAAFDCLKKSTYNDVRITKELFESEENKPDLYEVLFYCLKVNVYPFFKSLVSLLKNQFAGKN